MSRIENFNVETRLTFTLKGGAKIPESLRYITFFDGVGISLEGPQGKDSLPFVGPIEFRWRGENRVVAINRFPLPYGSQLRGKPINYLKSLSMLRVSCPIGPTDEIEKLVFLEISVSINNQDVWYYSEELESNPNIKPPFPGSPSFGLADAILDNFKKKLDAFD